MKFCPITLEPLAEQEAFSEKGLKAIHPQLTELKALPYTHEEQLRYARLSSDKTSIQGVKPKLSAVLSLKKKAFKFVDQKGRYILKPNPAPYQELPANEALTMTMAEAAGIDVPTNGMLPGKDGKWVYFVKRYDREGRSGKVHVEDFSQLTNATRQTKYNSSLKTVAQVVEQYCTFPALETPKLATRLLFCFLTGNEDMHLKKFSLWLRNGVVSLAPAYDLLNTTIVQENAPQESALPLNGMKTNLTRRLWFDYYFAERLHLKTRQIDELLDGFTSKMDVFRELIQRSHLGTEQKTRYLELFEARAQRIGLA